MGEVQTTDPNAPNYVNPLSPYAPQAPVGGVIGRRGPDEPVYIPDAPTITREQNTAVGLDGKPYIINPKIEELRARSSYNPRPGVPFPPPKEEEGGTGVGVSPGGGNFGEAVDDEAEGAVAFEGLKNHVLDLPTGARKTAAAFIRPEGESFAGVGGEHGKEWFEQALLEGPDKLGQALRDSQAAQADRSAAVGKFYDQEARRAEQSAAAIQHQRAQDSVELNNRQQKLDQATQFYTDDLANQGKFWSSPGNIISAIAFALMPIATKDAESGIKLINQAIDRDMANRRANAEGTLGALRSNLAGYHKIVGDRQAGDLMAESEARRVAATEVMRISQKFESPIAKAQAKAAYESLMMDAATKRMEVYKTYGIHQDATVTNKAVFDARGQGFDGAWRKYGSDPSGSNGVPSTGAAANGMIAGTQSVATADGSKALTVQESAQLATPQLSRQAALSGRVPGGVGMADVFKRSIANQAMAVSGYRETGDEKALAKAKVEIFNQAANDIKGFAPQLTPIAQQIAGVTLLQRDMDIIKRSEKNPDDFLNNTLSKMSGPEFANWYANKKRQFAGAPANSAEALEDAKADAAMRFRSLFADTMVDYYHSKAGANQAPGELANLKQVIHPGSSWSQVEAFVNTSSTKLNHQAKSVLAGASNPLAAMLYMTQTGIGTTRLPSRGVPAPQKRPPHPPEVYGPPEK